MRKICRVCGVEKDLADFNKHSSYKDGRTTKCNACIRLQILTNSAKSIALNKCFKDQICSKCKILKKASEFNKHKNMKNGLFPYCKLCRKEIRSGVIYENEQKARLIRRKSDIVSYKLRNIMWRAKRRSRENNLPFNLTLEYMRTLYTDICPVFGFPLNYTREKITPDCASLDKFIPDLGYVPGNVHIISVRANLLKKDASVSDIEKLLNWMKSIKTLED